MTTATPPVDWDQVADWFRTLYQGCDGYLHVACKGNWAGRFYTVDDMMIEPAMYVENLSRTATQGIYARVTTVREVPGRANGKRQRGGDDLSACLPALWADLDLASGDHKHAVCAGGAACEHLGEHGRRLHAKAVLPLPATEDDAREIIQEVSGLPEPSVWVHSGGGLYPLWLLDPPHHLTDDLAWAGTVSAGWQDVIEAAAARLGWHYGLGVGDLSRLLRVPGTWNRKPGLAEPQPCRVLESTGRRYALVDLADALERARRALPPPVTPQAVPPARRPASERPAGDVRPGDDFTASVDWDTPGYLLNFLGWKVIAQKGRYREWLRPGATSSLTATTGKSEHGQDNLWVFSTETPFPTNVVISKLEAFRIIHGYPTHKDAVRALNRLNFGSAPVRGEVVAPDRPDGLPASLTWPAGATPVRPGPPSPNGSQRPAQPVVDDDLPPLPTVDNRRQLLSTVDDEEPADIEPDPDLDVAPEEEHADDDEEEVDTWEPVDLGPYLRGEIKRAEPSLGIRRTDGVRLIYPGKEHAVIGEMEAGKGWFALSCCVEEMRAGRIALYVHFEEADPLDTVERLRELGCTDELILTYFSFVGPSRPIKPKQRRRLARMGAAIVILDGVNEGMSLHKADIRDENGAAEFRRIMVKPFTRRGAAVVSLDHVVKDRETRDRYALGSIHKGNALDGALIVLETQDAFGRNQRGRSSVFVVKDRPGFLRQYGRPTKLPGKTYMGEFVVDDRREAGASMSVTFYAPTGLDAGDIEPAAPLDVEADDDDRILAAIRSLIGKEKDSSTNLIQAEARIRGTRLREALARLTVAGEVVEIAGRRGSRVFVPHDDPRLSGSSEETL